MCETVPAVLSALVLCCRRVGVLQLYALVAAASASEAAVDVRLTWDPARAIASPPAAAAAAAEQHQ